MIKSLAALVTDELFSRFINIENNNYVIEYFETDWCKQLKEIDNSFINGYFGIYYLGLQLDPIANEIKKLESKIATLENIKCSISGFHYGSGYIDYLNSINSITNDIYKYSFEYFDANLSGIYTGSSGNLLSKILSKNFNPKDSTITDNMIQQYVDDDDNSFSHGKLGNLFVLLNLLTKKNNRTLYNLVLEKVKEFINNETSEKNYSLCNGNVTKYVILTRAKRIFKNEISIPDFKNDLLDNVYADVLLNKNPLPLNLCCGIAGLSDIFYTLWEETKDFEYMIISRELLEKKITENELDKNLSSGLLHGVFGILYQIFRVYPELNKKKVIPSLMFSN